MPRSPIFGLPLELLEEIIDIIQLDTQLSLCRVSKLFHSLAIRSVYRDISLNSPSTVVACCRTLTSNLAAAAAVRSFVITYIPSGPLNAHYFSSFYSIIGRALRRLSQLQDLQLMVLNDPNYIQTLNNCLFPGLHHFECYLALTDSLILFLNRHPNITYLQIAPNEALSPFSSPASVLPQVVLPKLEYFVGNSEFVSALVCDAALRAAFVFWDAIDATPQDAITALERSSSDTINVLSCRRRGWNLDLIELISNWLPNIYVLSITNLLVVDARPTEAYLDAIKNLLPRFTDLRRLHINCVDIYQMGDVECQMDADFATVTAWGIACPTLSECSLPHSDGLKWARLVDDLWLPDPSDRRGVKWLWEMLYSKRYPQWNKVKIAIEERSQKAMNWKGFEGTMEGLRALTLGGGWEDQGESLS